MSCCIACFKWNLNEDNRSNPPPQGHIYCGVPTKEEKALFLQGCQPQFQNNRWKIERVTAAEQEWKEEVRHTMEKKQKKWDKEITHRDK